MDKELNSKKILFVFCALVVLTVIVFGTALAFFSYEETSEATKFVKSGSVTLHYNEKELTRLNLENVLPMNETNGKKQDYFEFDITADTIDFDVPYVVTARLQGEAASRIPASYISLYLTEYNGTAEEQVLFTTYDQLTDVTKNNHVEQQLFTKTVAENTSNYSKTFRLRVWVNETANYSPYDDNQGNRIYPMEDKTFSITLNVYSNVSDTNQQGQEQEPTLPPGLYTLDDVLIEDWDTLIARGLKVNNELSGSTAIINQALDDNNEEVGKLIFGPVTAVGYSAFENCERLKAVVIPPEANVSYVRAYAFRNSGIESFIASVYKLESRSVASAPNLETVEIRQANSVESYSFENDTSLTTLKFTGNIDYIRYSVDQGCSNLEDVIITSNNTVIDTNAFYNPVRLYVDGTNVSGYYNIVKSNANRLEEVELHHVTSLNTGGLLEYIGSLKKVEVYDSSLHVQDFAYCRGLETVKIVNTNIGDESFRGDTSLKNVTLINVPSIGFGAFHECTSLEEITIPDQVTTIGNNAFLNCENLKTVNMGNSVESIGDYAFAGNKLTSITLPASLEHIGQLAFRRNASLQTITFADPSNWKHYIYNSSSDNFTSEPIDFSNPSNNVTILVNSADQDYYEKSN